MTRTGAFIGLGGNEGQPIENIRAAIERVAALPNTTLKATSPAYWTPAWGVASPQPDYLNAVIQIETALSAHELLLALQVIEHDFGRIRGPERYAARTLDLDILVFGESVIEDEVLSIPHPRLEERAFVLLPLADIAPDLDIPGLDRVDALLEALEAEAFDGIKKANVALYPTTSGT